MSFKGAEDNKSGRNSSSEGTLEIVQVADLTAAFAFQYEVTLRKETIDEQQLNENLDMTPAFAFSGKVAKLAENCQI